MHQQKLLIVYDGACPFCTAYVSLLRLRESMQVELLSARSADERINEFLALGYRLDDGMLVQVDGLIYVGAEAMHQLAIISNQYGMLNQIQRFVFSRKWLAHVLYPLLRLGRRLVLLIRRVPLIEDAQGRHKI
jgi:predicted DCC family thiol-disulfide oxidoreductase YuxK